MGWLQYSVCMQETHHVHAADPPSWNSDITLAEIILDRSTVKQDLVEAWALLDEDGDHDEGDANITMRIGHQLRTRTARFQESTPRTTAMLI